MGSDCNCINGYVLFTVFINKTMNNMEDKDKTPKTCQAGTDGECNHPNCP